MIADHFPAAWDGFYTVDLYQNLETVIFLAFVFSGGIRQENEKEKLSEKDLNQLYLVLMQLYHDIESSYTPAYVLYTYAAE